MAAAATLALVGLGCAGSDDDDQTGSVTTTTTAPTTTAESFEGTTGVVTGEATSSETALLERVAVGSHEGYDRVVFQFRDGLPGYRVEYAEPPLHEDGSGNVVELDGNAFVVVRMEPASGFDLTVPEGKLGLHRPEAASRTRDACAGGRSHGRLRGGTDLGSRARGARPVPRPHAREPRSDRRRLRRALRLIFDG